MEQSSEHSKFVLITLNAAPTAALPFILRGSHITEQRIWQTLIPLRYVTQERTNQIFVHSVSGKWTLNYIETNKFEMIEP